MRLSAIRVSPGFGGKVTYTPGFLTKAAIPEADKLPMYDALDRLHTKLQAVDDKVLVELHRGAPGADHVYADVWPYGKPGRQTNVHFKPRLAENEAPAHFIARLFVEAYPNDWPARLTQFAL